MLNMDIKSGVGIRNGFKTFLFRFATFICQKQTTHYCHFVYNEEFVMGKIFFHFLSEILQNKNGQWVGFYIWIKLCVLVTFLCIYCID